jgi:hypothetical protein
MADNKMLLLLAAAGVIVFFPQIAEFVKGFLAKAPSIPSSVQVVQSRQVGSDRASWLTDLMSLQRVLEANGQAKAADMLSAVMVEIIGMSDPKGGVKK